MKDTLRKLAIVLPCLWLLSTLAMTVEPNESQQGLPTAKAAVIICKGMIDDGLFKSIERRTKIALGNRVDYLIYEIDTYGGMVQSAVEISDELMIELGKKAHTVAYINTKALSAGAMISVSCRDIVMRDNATLGDCAPVMLGGKLEGVEREKVESFLRDGIFARAAETNGYPAAVLKAMVTMQTEVYRIKNLEKSRAEGKDVYEFFEGDRLPKDANEYDLENKVLEVTKDELLTLTASKAFDWGVARAVVKDRAGVFEFLAERDGVTFVEPTIVLRTSWSEEMVRKINHPAVIGVLFMIALLGVYIELNTPGVGLPGLVAVICFAIMIGSKYLVGLANWVEVALFIAGIILLMVEFFVLPGFGIAGFSGIMCILVGLFGMLIKNPPGKLPWPDGPENWDLFTDGVLGLSFGFLGFVVLAWLLTKYVPKLQFLSGLILVPTAAKQGTEMEVSMTVPPESETVGVNVGDAGEVVLTLRPTGKAKFGDAVVDVVAEGEFLDKGTKVEIIEIHGNRVVVRAVEN
jgi:membrane-bound serine protease (ClpP class)